MKRWKIYKVPHRRRREGRTNYKKRLKLLMSGKPRFVVRRTSNNTVCQVVEYKKEGDVTLASADFHDLKKLGWKAHTGNVPASYLIGLICGLKAKKKKVKSAVLDIGFHTSVKGAGVYAALKGFIESGIDVPHSQDILPDDNRVKGIHIEEYAKKLRSENEERYKKQFSRYLKMGFSPENLSKHFEEIREKILKTFK